MLPDGRVMGFIEYGDPNGFPIFVLQSFLQGRTSHTEACDQVDKRLGARVLVLDRPGNELIPLRV